MKTAPIRHTACCLAFLLLVGGLARAQKVVNMELVGQLSLGPSPACSVAGISVRVNDVWGYDSPSGTPLALVGLCDGTAIVDVTDPTNPTLLSTVPGPKSVWRDIKTFNQFAYIVHDILDASETNPAIGVQIVDLEDPTFPVVATLSDGFNRAHNLFIDTSRGHLYVANWKPASLLVAPGFLHPEEEHPAGGNGIRIYDLNASPTAPPFLGEWNQCNVHDLSVQGNVVYLACLRQGLWFVDVSDPTAPVTLDSFTYTQDTGGSPQTNYTHNVWPSGDGSFAVVTDEEKDQRVKFIEIPSFASPAVVSEYEALPAILAHNAFIRGDFTYISYYSEGVVVLESSDPSAVCELGYYDTYLLPVGPGATDGFRGAWGIYPYTASGLIYVSDISAGLYVLRFDPPSRAPIDLSLVLDVSGSMASTAIGGTTPKIEVLKDAVELFVEVWRPFTVPGDRLGIVYFESNVETAFIDGSISTPFCSYHKAFVTDVRGRFTGNLTALGGGLLTAVRSFEDTPKPRVVILVTDGMQNVSPMVVEAGIEAIFFDLGDTLVEDPGTGTWTLVPDAASAVAALKARGIRLGIITNVPSTWTRADLEARLESPEFLDEFEVIVLSSEAPAQKPDPAIYTHALSLLPNPPPVSHVAFVTETPEHIIGTNAMGEPVGAQAVGMVGILKAPGTSPDADHMVPNLTSIIPIVDASRTPKRHEVLSVPQGPGVYAESGVPGEPRKTLADLGPTIHTIGIGTAAGSRWQELLVDMATETGGLHHFTSAPDAQLQNFVEDALVLALQSGSVYRVARKEGTLRSGEADSVGFALNPTVSKLLVRLSWRGVRQSGLLVPELRRLDPSGQPGIPLRSSHRSQGAFYEVATWEFPLWDGERVQPPDGMWQLLVRRPMRRNTSATAMAPNSVPYSVSVLVDDGRLKSQVWVATGPFHTGQPIPIRARFALGDEALESVEVEVTVLHPRAGLGSLLAEQKAGPGRASPGTERFDPVEIRIEELSQDPAFRARLSAQPSKIVLAEGGGGKYEAVFTETRVPGSYRFNWIATGYVEGKRFHRSGSFVRTVRVRGFDASSVELGAKRLRDGRTKVQVTVRPRDRFHNYLGPGYADRIRIVIPGQPAPVRPVDKLDGTYVAEAILENFAVLADAKILLLGERISVPPDEVNRITGRRLNLGLHLGWAWPHGRLANAVGSGPSLSAALHWALSTRWSAGARINWARFDAAGFDDFDIFPIHAEFQGWPAPVPAGWRPFLEVGAGPDILDWDDVEFGIHIGAGLKFPLRKSWHGEIAYRYFKTVTGNSTPRYSQVQFGLIWRIPNY